MKSFRHPLNSDISTAPNSLASTCSSHKSRKAATYVQPKRKKKLTLTSHEEASDENLNITFRPLVPPTSTRRYEDTSTRIQRRSQSRKRDALLTMLRGFTAKQRVYVSTATDGMRF
mmetsp:Transcript_9847/g.16353  ORF Transcript_9847/g.16353 Transcript_9847/m.16353 type:complete len:116 (+) Transcript_9847:123-470(+)